MILRNQKFSQLGIIIALVLFGISLIVLLYYLVNLQNYRLDYEDRSMFESDLSMVSEAINYSQQVDLLDGVRKGSVDGEIVSINQQNITLKIGNSSVEFVLLKDVNPMVFDFSSLSYLVFNVDFLVEGLNVSLKLDNVNNVKNIYVYPKQTIRGDVLKISNGNVVIKNIFEEKEYNLDLKNNFIIFDSVGEMKTVDSIFERSSVLVISNDNIEDGINSGWLMMVN